MKLSIIIPVYNSNEAVRRQILYLNELGLPRWAEVIFVDHMSDGRVRFAIEPKFNCKIVLYPDQRPWAIASCFNVGARNATGEYFMFTGIDHMINRGFLLWAKGAEQEYAVFERMNAVLDKSGGLEILDGYKPAVSKNWISRKAFYDLDGFNQNMDVFGGEDLDLLKRYIDYEGTGKIRYDFIVKDVFLYMYPEKGDRRRPDFLNHKRKKYPREGKDFVNGVVKEKIEIR